MLFSQVMLQWVVNKRFVSLASPAVTSHDAMVLSKSII